MAQTLQELESTYDERFEHYRSVYGRPVRTDKNGTTYFAYTRCSKCGGQGGSDAWVYTGWQCYRCGGSGIDPHPDLIKLYKPAYEVKLEAQREKREAKKRADHDAKLPEIRKAWLDREGWNEDGTAYVFLGNTFEQKDAIKATGARFNAWLGWYSSHETEGFKMLKLTVDDALEQVYDGYAYKPVDAIKKLKKDAEEEVMPEAPANEFYGTVGDRIEVRCKYTSCFEFVHKDYFYGYGCPMTTTTYIHIFKDEDGHIFKWQTSKCLDLSTSTEVTLKGTIKEHSEYKGDKQTVLLRCKVETV